MRYLILLFLTFFITSANEELNETQPQEEIIEAKLLYQSYFEPPTKLFKGEVFTLTIKSLSTKKNYSAIDYDFSNAVGLTKISEEKIRKAQPPYFYDTFYFQVKGNSVRIPNITTTLSFDDGSENITGTIQGQGIRTVKLNPEKDFSNILAHDFKILEYKTTSYDNNNNIVVFSAESKMGNIKDISLKVASKEGVEEYTEELPMATITYYAVIPKTLNELKFSYFNLETRQFKDIIIPIIVTNDSVSTQTDLAPTQNTHTVKKMIAAGAVSFLFLTLFIYRKKKIYLIPAVLPLFVVAYLAVPTKHVCINSGAQLYLLPMQNGTIFGMTQSSFITEELSRSSNFVKIKTPTKEIGWIKDEDICKN